MNVRPNRTSPRDADQPQLGDVADLDAVQRALLVDVKLGAAEQIEQLDPARRSSRATSNRLRCDVTSARDDGRRARSPASRSSR